MKLRKNKSIVIPSIFACCSFMIAAPSSAAALPTGENIVDSSRQVVDVLGVTIHAHQLKAFYYPQVQKNGILS
ncbi:hypothetical protein PDQ79_31295 [Bacillus cereus]|nr:hypothetical protein [Bacillus cereus]